MVVRVVLRSYGGDNDKDRPAYYGKDLALASFVRAVRAADVEAVFVNDGPVPEHRLRLMRQVGEVVQIPDGPVGMRASYVFALDMASDPRLAPDDVLAFDEDDYLFTADAFAGLAAAARELPDVDYFALSGRRPADLDDPAELRLHAAPRHWTPAPDRRVGDVTWVNVLSTTSTFAGRVGALRADRDIFLQCMRPFRSRFLDHETCLLYQGIRPYHGREYLTGLAGDFVPGARGVARALVLVPYRVAMARRARRQSRPHLLYAPQPTLAHHMETGGLAPDRDWAAEAQDVLRWAREAGLDLPGLEHPAAA